MFAKPFSLGVGTVIAAAAIAVCSAPAHAFAYFTPGGSNLDGDPIKDLVTMPGASLTFDLGLNLSFLNPSTLSSPLDILVEWDTSELAYTGVSLAPSVNFLLSGVNSAIFSVLNPTASNISFGSIEFQVLSGLANDGLSDFQTSFALSQIFPSGSGLENAFVTQTVEVQPVPTPALLPGLVGLGVAALRRKGDTNSDETA